ncbi:amidohydrolase [Aspergillus luchuensis]|uniref:Amidohydrolase n=1 Tax=Aspergillus kawachii TaxID=1069201 RepID=A0A146F1B2_ASPKA|nr:amidohydrolase [Aspergillus luchuensis]
MSDPTEQQQQQQEQQRTPNQSECLARCSPVDSMGFQCRSFPPSEAHQKTPTWRGSSE